MYLTRLPGLVVMSAALFCGSDAMAQLRNPYGEPIALESAKLAASAAIAKARANSWFIAVAVVDPGGNLVYFEKMDGTQNASPAIAIDKARAAALFKRPTRAFEEMLASGAAGLRVLDLRGAVALEGGVPLLLNGAIVGAIGVSGATSVQDGQCAQAGAQITK